jgi:hypothetical protein
VSAERPGYDNSNGSGDDNQDEQGDVTHDKRWVALGQAARELGVSRTAIYRRIERGSLRSRPRGNRGLEVLLPKRPGGDEPYITSDRNPDEQGYDHRDEPGHTAPELLELRDGLAAARVTIARLEERLLSAEAQSKAEVAAHNAVIEQVREALTHERARSERLEAELVHLRRTWIERLLEALRRR